ncbi:F-box/RNI-like/FBD-like domains-containing protein [Rhynchospora pubera]|uniref:F-box/RNI-like/FBD-like domains-containing protein n=1 Tax=Rhynchospora pubera TaxID=906938 RepID=A0AAV8EXB8_9POAL|nr:F-box/RNI-like/FBD-like domains-containing protein [Rhynchospora pubera]
MLDARASHLDEEESQVVDYISNLPDDLRWEILLKLPIRELVRTSILSTKWKDSWISVPSLIFEENSNESRLIDMVDNVLMARHNSILQFKLVSKYPCNAAISRWFLFLYANGVKDLQLNFSDNARCNIPFLFFSCHALELVNMSCCSFNVPDYFQGFKLLRTLSLQKFDLTGISIGNLVSSCSLLECLVLVDFVQQGYLHIVSSKLRELQIDGDFHDLHLETPKLVSANIYLHSVDDQSYELFSVAKAGNESNLTQALGCLHNIQKLELDGEFMQYLAMGLAPKNLPTIFNHLTQIHITIWALDENEIATALCLFKSVPSLKVLDIQICDYWDEDQPQVQTLQRSESTKYCSLFKCLEIVNIIDEGDPEFSLRGAEFILEFAEYMLTTAPVLQKLNFIDFEDSMGLVRKLECIPKLSTKAEIGVISTN